MKLSNVYYNHIKRLVCIFVRVLLIGCEILDLGLITLL